MLYKCLSSDFVMIMSSDEFHRTLMMISQHRVRLWLGAIRQQAITLAIVDPVLCRHMTLLGHNELTEILLNITLGLEWWSANIDFDKPLSEPYVFIWYSKLIPIQGFTLPFCGMMFDVCSVSFTYPGVCLVNLILSSGGGSRKWGGCQWPWPWRGGGVPYLLGRGWTFRPIMACVWYDVYWLASR